MCHAPPWYRIAVQILRKDSLFARWQLHGFAWVYEQSPVEMNAKRIRDFEYPQRSIMEENWATGSHGAPFHLMFDFLLLLYIRVGQTFLPLTVLVVFKATLYHDLDDVAGELHILFITTSIPCRLVTFYSNDCKFSMSHTATFDIWLVFMHGCSSCMASVSWLWHYWA